MRTAAFIAALAVVVPTIHAQRARNAQRARYLMGTVCEVAVTGEHAEAQIEAAFAEAKRVELMLSTWIAESELSRVNRGAAPGDELCALLDVTAEWTKKTNGAFDPRYRRAQGAEGRGQKASARPGGRAGASCALRPALCALPSAPCPLDSGAFGKGYALDRMLALTTGNAVIDFGGQLLVRGEHEVAIADPTQRDHPVLALTIANASLSTSSTSEQPGHIVDPRTGEALPARGSVSVIADDALTADILSTALYVMGEDDGLRWADANGVAAIFITPSHHVRLSARARERARAPTLLDRNFRMKD
jgi:thiamine biosynthesis lipoprotein